MKSDFVKISPQDDVIIALRDFRSGEIVDGIKLNEPIIEGHKILIHDMKKGEYVHKYGNIIGVLTKDSRAGDWVHSQNMSTSLASLTPSYSYHHETFPLPKASSRTFDGYLRKNGLAGTRNDVFIIPLVGCVNGTAALLEKKFIEKHPDMDYRVKVLSHPYGCSQLGDDLETTRNLLGGLSKNPNAGGVLLLGLGCENNRLSSFLAALGEYDHERVLSLQCQDYEDEVSEGLTLLETIYARMSNDKRVPLPLSYLRLGLKCGGSDGLSGLTANPLVGLVSDVVGASGGIVALTEVPEMFGAEESLMNRAKDEDTFEKTVRLIEGFKAYYSRNNQPCYENPSPGNKDGGITTLEEKSSGCILKGGHLPVNDVIDVGGRLSVSGLTLVNGPGNDLVAATNLAAAGANILFFTTGRGTPYGSVIPTIKVATNHIMAKRKAGWIDFDAERALDEGFEKASSALLDALLQVASGKLTKEEENKMWQIALFKQGVTL